MPFASVVLSIHGRVSRLTHVNNVHLLLHVPDVVNHSVQMLGLVVVERVPASILPSLSS